MATTPLAVKNLALGIESTFGTSVTPTAYGEIDSCDIKLDKDVIVVDDTAGTRKGGRQVVYGAQKVSGSVKSNVYPAFVGYWLKGALGSCSSVLKSGETAVYEHTFSQANTLPSFTLVLDRGNSEYVKYTSVVVKSLKMNAKDKLVELSVALDCYDESIGSSYTPSQATENPFVFHNVNIGFGDSISAARTAVSSSPTPVLSWDFEYDNQTQVSHASGSAKAYRIDPKLAKIKFSFSVFFDNTTHRDAYRNLTKKAAVIRMTGASIGNSSNYNLDIELPAIYYTAQTVDYKAGNLEEEKCELVGIYDDIATHACQMILTNLKANYTS